MKALEAIARDVANDPTVSSSEMEDAIEHLERSIALSSRVRNLVVLKAYRVMTILKIAIELRSRDSFGVLSDRVPRRRPTRDPTQE